MRSAYFDVVRRVLPGLALAWSALHAALALAAPPPIEWPLPWTEIPIDEELGRDDARRLDEGDPLRAVCAAYLADPATDLLCEAPLPTWRCSKLQAVTAAGPGRLREAAVVRLAGLSACGAVDVLLLALDEGGGWRLASVLADSSYAGAGGVVGGAALDDLRLSGDTVVAWVRRFHSDTDLGVNAVQVWLQASLGVCVKSDEAHARCAVAPTFVSHSLSQVNDDEPGPPADYGPLGQRVWQRPVTWEPRGFRVYAPRRNDLDSTKPIALSPGLMSPAAFVAAHRR